MLKQPSRCIIKIDYSQLELRIAAERANINGMIQEYAKGFSADLHWKTAHGVYNLPPELKQAPEGSKEHEKFVTFRKKGKPINFGCGYGQQAKGFQTNIRKDGLIWTLEECQEAIDGFFKTYPEYKEYQQDIQQYFIDQWLHGTEEVYMETMFGRKRWFSIVEKAKNNQIGLDRYGKTFAFVNDAINHPIQGTAADLIKRAMVKAKKLIKEEGYDAKMILQVHDELVLDCYIPHVVEVAEIVGKVSMIDHNQDYFEKVPLATDVSIGTSWGECVEIDKFIGKAKYQPEAA